MRDARDQRRRHRYHRGRHRGTRLARDPGDARAGRRAWRRPGSRAPPGRRNARRGLVSAIGIGYPPMTRILVVDDHALVRRGLIQILQGLPDGVQFGEAGTAAEAMTLASNERWDVVLLDLGLPDRHGLGGPPPAPHEQLSDRELEVWRLLAAGRPITAISRQLGLSPKTVTTYRARLLHKLRMRSNAELTFYATQHGLVSAAALRSMS